AGLALDATLLVRLRRRAEVACEAPVRAESDEPRGLLALMAAQDLLYRALQVIVPEQPKDSAKIMKRVLVGLEKRLLGGAMIGPMNAAPLIMLRSENTCSLTGSPLNSAHASYQSTWPSCPGA